MSTDKGMNMDRADIWVVCESAANAVLGSSLELVGEAAALARSAHEAVTDHAEHFPRSVTALLFADSRGPAAGSIDALAASGADRVYILEVPGAAGPDEGERCSDDSVFARAIARVAERERPDIVLMAATVFGRSVMPRVAARLRTGLTADCTALRLEEDGTLVQTRPAYGANLLAEVVCGTARPQMATVRPGVFRAPEPDPARRTDIVRLQSGFRDPGLVRLLRRDEAKDSGSDLSSARFVVAGGRGVGSKEGFRALERLAKALGGAVGASRSAVEAGYAPYSKQVGQTGLTIRPELYLACGISGSVQHLAGMSGAGYVIAINADRNAPIFDHADYGIVGDLRVVVEAMIKILESHSGSTLDSALTCP